MKSQHERAAQRAARAINARSQKKNRDDVRVRNSAHRDALVQALSDVVPLTEWRRELTQ